MKDMYCDSDDNNVMLLLVINSFYTCQADVDTKMTVGMFMCMTQNGEMCTVVCTVGTSTCLSLVQTRCMKTIWFGYNTLKSDDSQQVADCLTKITTPRAAHRNALGL